MRYIKMITSSKGRLCLPLGSFYLVEWDGRYLVVLIAPKESSWLLTKEEYERVEKLL